MSQVLVNLITNAVYAMPAGGSIYVITKSNATNVKLIVKDTGVGMTTEVKHRIFEPFFTTKEVGQGTGLGLSVVQGIIDSHNGQIIVNTSPGKGTKFEIQLPLKQEKKKRSS
jgi:signal transduction histidine kinase